MVSLHQIQGLMIQRIQTIFLLVAAVASSLTLFLSFGKIVDISGTYYLTSTGFYQEVDGGEKIELFSAYPLIGMALLTMLVSVAAIFLYKNRKLQVRVSQVNMLLNGVFFGVIFLYVQKAEAAVNVVLHYQIGIIAPFLAIISLILAGRYINKDEQLVRSTERLR